MDASDADRKTHAVDLAELIQTAKGGRSYEQLSIDSGGRPGRQRLQQLATTKLKNFPDPDTIIALSKGLGVSQRACGLARVAPARIHDLRHTYASWQLQAGQSIAEVGQVLGHVSATTTQRYAHLAPPDPARITAAVDWRAGAKGGHKGGEPPLRGVPHDSDPDSEIA